MQTAELAERFGTTDTDLLKRSQRVGLLRELGEGTYEEVSPRLMCAAAEDLVS